MTLWSISLQYCKIFTRKYLQENNSNMKGKMGWNKLVFPETSTPVPTAHNKRAKTNNKVPLDHKFPRNWSRGRNLMKMVVWKGMDVISSTASIPIYFAWNTLSFICSKFWTRLNFKIFLEMKLKIPWQWKQLFHLSWVRASFSMNHWCEQKPDLASKAVTAALPSLSWKPGRHRP